MPGATDTVVVTGAARGIGRAVAAAFAREGADVVVADVDEAAGAETAADLPGAGRSASVPVDVAREDEVEALAEYVTDEFDGADVLVNNAGTFQFPHRPTVEQSVDEWQRHLDVHLRGTYLCSKTLAPPMLERGGGRIVNMSSISGLAAIPEHTAYGPAKSAINMLTKVLAVEWADRGVRVNAVAPGHVRTGWLEDEINRGRIDADGIEERTPMARLAEPADVADAVTFLAGDRARYVTGVVLPVDGGWTAYGYI